MGERDFWLESFWSNTRRSESNPTLIVVQILLDKGLGVKICDEATDSWERLLPGHRAIFAWGKGRSILDKVIKTPEFEAIWFADIGFSGGSVVESCQWDEKTKSRVLALYWQKRARFYQEWADELAVSNVEYYAEEWRSQKEAKAKEYSTKAQQLLGKLPPLTPDDIQSLLEPVIDRVLAQSPKPS